jgi:glycerol-3-phosphate acyltransferase PlsY
MCLWQEALWFILGGFLAGSIPFGLLIARAKGIDLRTVGSGNIGATNAWRALGWKLGLTVVLLDALKGLMPVALWLYWSRHGAFETRIYPEFISAEGMRDWSAHLSWQLQLLPMAVGLAAILGHTFTPWLKFKGGKGVATGLGVVIALFQWWTLVPLAVFGVTLGLSRMVSLSSIAAALSLAALSLAEPLFHAPHAPGLGAYWPFAVLTALLVMWTHRANIRRIIAGTEPRIGGRKQA